MLPGPGFLGELAPIVGTVSSILLLVFVVCLRGRMSRVAVVLFVLGFLSLVADEIHHAARLHAPHGSDLGLLEAWLGALAPILILAAVVVHLHDLGILRFPSLAADDPRDRDLS